MFRHGLLTQMPFFRFRGPDRDVERRWGVGVGVLLMRARSGGASLLLNHNGQ